RRRNTIFSEIIGSHAITSLEVRNLGITTGELVSGNYFDMLGVRASVGRMLLPEDDSTPESSPVAVISHAYWKRVFGGSPEVLEKKIQVQTAQSGGSPSGRDVYDAAGPRSLDGAVLTIVGVAPPGFFGDAVGRSTDVWIPIMMQPAVMPGRPFLSQRNAEWVNLMGRLKPGASQSQGSAALAVLYRQLVLDEEGSQITEERRREIAAYTLRTESGEKGFGAIRHEFSQ